MNKMKSIYVLHVNADQFKTYKSKWGAIRAAKSYKKSYENPNFWVNGFKAKVADGTATEYEKKLVAQYDGYPQVVEYPLRKGQDIEIK